jgi:hypothetical protein
MAERERLQVDPDDRSAALYHVVYQHEGFEHAAQAIFKLVQMAQEHRPNQKRGLYLDIEGHRNDQGGFDSDMLELQKDFLLGFLSPFLSEIRCPLFHATNPHEQDNDIPPMLIIQSQKD